MQSRKIQLRDYIHYRIREFILLLIRNVIVIWEYDGELLGLGFL